MKRRSVIARRAPFSGPVRMLGRSDPVAWIDRGRLALWKDTPTVIAFLSRTPSLRQQLNRLYKETP